MKKIIVFIAVFLYADISNIITLIKNMENYRPVFKKIQHYKPFSDEVIPTKENGKIFNVSPVNLSLNAIFQNKAFINGRWVKRGDLIEGYKVIKITQNSVVLFKNGKIKKITLNPKVIKVKQ